MVTLSVRRLLIFERPCYLLNDCNILRNLHTNIAEEHLAKNAWQLLL
jgi:hypothetical protein